MTRNEYRENCPSRKENILIDGTKEWGCMDSVSFRLHGILFPCDDSCDYMKKYVPDLKKEKCKMTKKEIYPEAEDTKLYLPYNIDGEVSEDGRLSLRMDELRRKYKRCSKCKRWFLLDTFSLRSSSPDKHSSLCHDCEQSLGIQPPEKSKHSEAQSEETKDVTSDSVPTVAILSDVSDVDLLQEIKHRGWKGNLQVTMNFEF